MKNKKKNLKWIIWSSAGIFTIGISIYIFLLMYIGNHQDNLNSYKQSIGNLPEVAEILEFSHFTGTDEYLVAKVRRTDDAEYIYFIKNEVVAQQFPVSDFIGEEMAQSIALNATESRELQYVTLGMYFENPIYELKFITERGAEYLIIDAQTGEILLQFTLDS